jgi:hypothetical protein
MAFETRKIMALKKHTIYKNANNHLFVKGKFFCIYTILFIASFNIATAKEIINETEMTILGVPIKTKQKTFLGGGKASIELEDNDSSRIELDQQEELFKSDPDKN